MSTFFLFIFSFFFIVYHFKILFLFFSGHYLSSITTFFFMLIYNNKLNQEINAKKKRNLKPSSSSFKKGLILLLSISFSLSHIIIVKNRRWKRIKCSKWNKMKREMRKQTNKQRVWEKKNERKINLFSHILFIYYCQVLMKLKESDHSHHTIIILFFSINRSSSW